MHNSTFWLFSVLLFVVLTNYFVFAEIKELQFTGKKETKVLQWAVAVKPGTNITFVAEKHNLEVLHDPNDHGINHLYVLQPKSLLQFEADYQPELHLEDSIYWFEQQFRKRRYKRNITPIPPSDPLYSQEWYLHDAEIKLNVEEAWKLGYTGKGSTICIIDDGIEWRHKEFATNFNKDASRDVNFGNDDISPYSWDEHGTASAGVAAGPANNGICGVGVAPEAQVSGVRLLATDATDAQEAIAFSYRNDLNDIYSNSWGPTDDGIHLEAPGYLAQHSITNSVWLGRNKKGSIFIWAGGNGKRNGDSCNYDGYANSIYTLAVASSNYLGKEIWYSENCASLLAFTPSSNGGAGAGKEIKTTGTGQSCYLNFGGTSASSPQAAGVAALLLQVNPDFSWRDVMGIFVESAVPPVSTPQNGWTKTAAGRLHHYALGYGALNAFEAVTVAQNWTLMDEMRVLTAATTKVETISRSPSKSATVTVDVTQDLLIEQIEITPTVDFDRRGHLSVSIISPNNIESKLMAPHNDINPDLHNWTFTSARHWGESSVGTWKLVVTNDVGAYSGKLRGFELKLYGTSSDTSIPTVRITQPLSIRGFSKK